MPPAPGASTTSVGPAATGTSIGPASQVPVGGAESFTDPATGQPAFVLQLAAGQFSARSAICTHQGCTVAFSQPDLTFVCPCHGSVYDARSGRVLQGPAPSPLPSIRVAERADGNLYVDGQ
jgi:thiosulfate dehydrogenase [quinone] large subunit